VNSGTTDPSTYTLTITGTGGGLTKSTTVTLIVAPIQKQSYMTDSVFNPITSMDVVFTPDEATSSLKLVATNPGTYYYNKIVTNTGGSSSMVHIDVTIPASDSPPGPTLPQAFGLKGSYPIHVYADLARAVDVTSQTTISPTQPIGGASSQSLTYVPTVSVSFTIPAGELRYITIHLDFAGKGSVNFPQEAQTTYLQGFKFLETITVDGISGSISDVTTFTAVGKRVTGIGGFALDTHLDPKSALKVKVLSGSTPIGTSPITPEDGYYFVPVPPSTTPYTVQLFNPGTGNIVKTDSVASIATDEYKQVDFLNLNPADPAIEGFIFDQNTRGISGVTVQLYDRQDRLIASTTTSASGWYAFRFNAPGEYTVKIVVPPGYTTSRTSATVSIRQFQTLRVDFTLAKT